MLYILEHWDKNDSIVDVVFAFDQQERDNLKRDFIHEMYNGDILLTFRMNESFRKQKLIEKIRKVAGKK